MRAWLCVLLLAVPTSSREATFDDDLAATLDRAEQIGGLVGERLAEDMDVDDEIRRSSPTTNPVDQFIFQSLDRATKIPIPEELQPRAAIESENAFRALFGLTDSPNPKGSGESSGGGRITATIFHQQDQKVPPVPEIPDPQLPDPKLPDPKLPEPPKTPNPPPVPKEVPKLSEVTSIKDFAVGNRNDLNVGPVKLAPDSTQRDRVFQELYQNAYVPGLKFVDNAIKDLEEMWAAANGNLGKQMLVAETANQFILPAVTGIWPALFYHRLEHMAAQKVAPSWWPTDPMPNVPGSKRLPQNSLRGGVTGASEVMNRQLGLSTGNLKHSCTMNEMLDCID
eukprot:c38890_g1_i1.p2 GENE.c38890_g1_i1~~c38890_g1_i1.p2  ORF type:complete len:338 (+),score=73.53 c38890_g1_i1:1108-2121(+)